ncbi:hypothetical protein Mal35_08880 [Gimesia maris]|uniref:STAS-like domain-containing protein n=1 Tax=Gimesia maris TaxID=122 RepID=UPI00118980E0|nr:DUF4325 domain-containing protein [Gimesia maris]QDT77462.1 hypothetical protein Mal35_08880 [Gimesia maris]
MVGVRKRGEEIRQFILKNVEKHSSDIVAITASQFQISRQAVNKHIKLLVEQKAILVKGATRSRRYSLHPLIEWSNSYDLENKLEEDVVWQQDISKFLKELPDNVRDIWHYGFTEMLNNAIDHSSGSRVIIHIEKTASTTNIMIIDDGEGIFKKIQRELGLSDERHSVLELAKGKLTTDPNHHSGEGIFFSSRMFDRFAISSGSTYFSHEFDKTEDWIIEHKENKSGTAVFMYLSNNSSRTSKGVFDNFTSNDDYGFTKTIVPVHLAQYGDDQLISRSQAKRLLVRIEKFKKVIFDFDEVETIGQAFADEIFRVFQLQHKEMELVAINTQKQVQQMISRALSKE